MRRGCLDGGVHGGNRLRDDGTLLFEPVCTGPAVGRSRCAHALQPPLADKIVPSVDQLVVTVKEVMGDS